MLKAYALLLSLLFSAAAAATGDSSPLPRRITSLALRATSAASCATPPLAGADLRGFKAANPKWQSVCEKYLGTVPPTFFSDYAQDWFVLHNFFRNRFKGARPVPGFYVDVGANDAIDISNTAFLDVCLGWKGICIEPNPGYHAALRSQRTCELVTNCIAEKEGTVLFEMNGRVGSVVTHATSTTRTVLCRPLGDVLLERGVNKVDFMSIDIEGHELNIARTFPWSRVNVSVFSIESSGKLGLELTQILGTKGNASIVLSLGRDVVAATIPTIGKKPCLPPKWPKKIRAAERYSLRKGKSEVES